MEGRRHAGRDRLVIHVVRRSAGKLGAAVAVRVGTRSGAKVVAEMDIQLARVGVLLRWRIVSRLVRGGLADPVDVEVRETSVQSRRRDVGIRQGVHGSQILCRNVATKRAERSPRTTARARCAVAIGIHLAVQLVHLVLAVERRCLISGKLVGSSATRRRVLVTQIVVVVDGDVGRDEDRDRKRRAQLTDVAIRIVELDAKLQLVTNLDALGVRILQTAGQGEGHVQEAGELVALGRFIDDFDLIFIDQVFVREDGPGDFVGVANGIGIFRVESEVVALDQL